MIKGKSDFEKYDGSDVYIIPKTKGKSAIDVVEDLYNDDDALLDMIENKAKFGLTFFQFLRCIYWFYFSSSFNVENTFSFCGLSLFPRHNGKLKTPKLLFRLTNGTIRAFHIMKRKYGAYFTEIGVKYVQIEAGTWKKWNGPEDGEIYSVTSRRGF